MSLETQLASLEAAVIENTAALKAVLAAGGASPAPEKPAAAPKGKAAKAAPAPAPEPEPAPAPVEEPVTERPTKVAAPAPAETEFSDPLDPDTTVVVQGTTPAIDPDAVIAQITDTWKAMLTAADADRKTMLKDKFPELRTKWGLAEGAKLISLAATPEKLVGLLEDIKTL